MREPAIGYQKVDELLGQRNMAASLEGHGRIEAPYPDRERLAVGAVRPLGRRRVLVVVLRALEP